MRSLHAFALLALLAAAPAAAAAVTAAPSAEERLKAAKALFFDRKYVEARQAWQAILAASREPEASAAAYWIARCSESLGDEERALSEYGTFLDRPGKDPALADEARTSRVGLAARLHKAGRRQYATLLKDALASRDRTLRYYAALQVAPLGGDLAATALPVLRAIVAEEKDPDLVDRARLHLLRLDPGALSGSSPAAPGPARTASWLKVRIYEKGGASPKVTLNVPVALADIVFKSLPDDARLELNKKGYDPENFWTRLKSLGPAEILTIDAEDGDRIQIWIE